MKTEPRNLKLREQIHCQIRKTQLHKIFEINRQLITVQVQRKDEQQFANLYQTIDQSNFSSLLPQIKRWAWSEKFSNKIVSLVAYLYDYLLINADDNSMSILEALSSFEEIQIPQTKQLATILLSQLNMRPINTMTIISNLLSNEKYGQYLCKYLLNLGLIQQCKRYLLTCPQRLSLICYQELNLLFVDICCSVITSLPLIDFNLFEIIVQELSLNSKGKNEQLVFWAINQIARNFQPNYKIACSIDKYLGSLCYEKYFSYEAEVIKFYHYCCSSHKQLNTIAIQLIIQSLDKYNQSIYVEALLILTMILKVSNVETIQQVVSRMEQLNAVSIIIDKYEISSYQIKIKCIQILQLIIHVLLKNILNTQKQTIELIQQLFQDIACILADSIQSPASLLQTQGLILLLNILNFIYDQEPFYAKCFQQQISEFKIIDLLQNMPSRIDPRTNTLIIHITTIYESI